MDTSWNEIGTDTDTCKNNIDLEALMDTYSNMLFRTAVLMLRDRKLAEDAVQETFIGFYTGIGKYRGEAGVKTYLSRILVNECRQRLRKAWFRHNILTVEPEEAFVPGADPFSEADDRISLAGALIKLDTKSREALLLYYYSDLSIPEICEATGEPEGTVKSRLKRGRDKLKRILQEDLFHE